MPHASPANLSTEEESQKAVKEMPGKSTPMNNASEAKKQNGKPEQQNQQTCNGTYVGLWQKEKDIHTEVTSVKAMN